jgi:hypothetical protein
MRKSLSAIGLAASLFVAGWSQTTHCVSFPDQGQNVADFLPPGWEIVREAKGDLNGDGLEDEALVIRGTDANLHKPSDMMVGESKVKTVNGKVTLSTVLDQNPRTILVLVKQESGYRLAGKNDTLLPTPRFPNGETLNGFDIKAGQLNIGLIFMDRRHGEVYAKDAYQFQMSGSELALTSATKIKNDRHVENTVVQKNYDFKAQKLVVRTTQFSTGSLISENEILLKAPSPDLNEIRSNWDDSATPMP